MENPQNVSSIRGSDKRNSSEARFKFSNSDEKFDDLVLKNQDALSDMPFFGAQLFESFCAAKAI